MGEDMLFMTEDQSMDLNVPQGEDTVGSRKYLIFVIDDLKLGVDAGYVVEIITNHVATYLPRVPEFIRGIINLRGQMIPIVDIRLRLGKPSLEGNLVIVLNIEGTQLGILVDSVDQMVDIHDKDILPMPLHSVQQLVSGMCSVPDGSGTMMVLDCEQLMPHE